MTSQNYPLRREAIIHGGRQMGKTYLARIMAEHYRVRGRRWLIESIRCTHPPKSTKIEDYLTRLTQT